MSSHPICVFSGRAGASNVLKIDASPTEFRSEFRVGEKQSDETRSVCDRTKEIHMDVIELIGSALELLGGTELLGTLLETGSAVLGLGQ